jgi:hypothetical protein
MAEMAKTVFRQGLANGTVQGDRAAAERFVGDTPTQATSQSQSSNPYAANYKPPFGPQGGTPVAGSPKAADDTTDAESLDQRRRRAALILGSTETDQLGEG